MRRNNWKQLMRIIMTGASGFIGRHLEAFLQKEGHQVFVLRRNTPEWDPERDHVDTGALEGADALIHLSGESVVSGLWTEAKKTRMQKSRIDSTKLLSRALKALKNPPKVFICASATGWYGSRGDELLTEDSHPGTGFLAELCREWEQATDALRVVNLRIGIVLDPSGGMLKKVLPIFKFGLGGKIGSGKQWMSWIDMRDLTRAVSFLLEKPLSGPFNMVSPNPVTNATFTTILAGVLQRPAFCRVPAWILRLLLGQMAEETLLSSSRVLPKRLQEAGFEFHFPDLARALSGA